MYCIYNILLNILRMYHIIPSIGHNDADTAAWCTSIAGEFEHGKLMRQKTLSQALVCYPEVWDSEKGNGKKDKTRASKVPKALSTHFAFINRWERERESEEIGGRERQTHIHN